MTESYGRARLDPDRHCAGWRSGDLNGRRYQSLNRRSARSKSSVSRRTRRGVPIHLRLTREFSFKQGHVRFELGLGNLEFGLCDGGPGFGDGDIVLVFTGVESDEYVSLREVRSDFGRGADARDLPGDLRAQGDFVVRLNERLCNDDHGIILHMQFLHACANRTFIGTGLLGFLRVPSEDGVGGHACSEDEERQREPEKMTQKISHCGTGRFRHSNTRVRWREGRTTDDPEFLSIRPVF